MSATLEQAFERQIGWCREPSPFTARVLARTLAWLPSAPDARAALDSVADDPLAAAVSLRWAAGLHHLALRGLQPWAGLWPGGDDAALQQAIAHAWATQQPALRRALASPPQTNEVQRSALLLPGLLHVAAATGRPLALREIGASAGLNLWPERHRYDHGSWQWGDAAAPVALRCDWRGPVPPMPALAIADRQACDAEPVDITLPDEALRLQSFVWADQHARMARLRAAVQATVPWLQREGVQVRRERAAAFVQRVLAARPHGVATVLMHSIVWQYIPAAEQQAIADALQRAAATADAASPLAWLRLEPPEPLSQPELRCTVWPGGQDRCLARAHAHAGAAEACA